MSMPQQVAPACSTGHNYCRELTRALSTNKQQCSDSQGMGLVQNGGPLKGRLWIPLTSHSVSGLQASCFRAAATYTRNQFNQAPGLTERGICIVEGLHLAQHILCESSMRSFFSQFLFVDNNFTVSL